MAKLQRVGTTKLGIYALFQNIKEKALERKLLKEKLEENKGRDIEIQYFKQNPVGTLYERLGFVPNGDTRYHYQMIKYGKKEES